MIIRYLFLIGLLAFTTSCVQTQTETTEIEFISMEKKELERNIEYDIVFLSETDYSISEPSDTDSYISCVASKEIYDKNFQQDSAKANTLGGVLSIPQVYKNTNKFIYKVNLEYAIIKTLKDNDKDFYCRVITPKFMGSAKQSQVFRIYN